LTSCFEHIGLFTGCTHWLVCNLSCSNTPLHVAACWARTAAASNLLSSGVVDVNCTSSNGSTALHLAARTNDRAMVKLLLAAGANPSAENLGP